MADQLRDSSTLAKVLNPRRKGLEFLVGTLRSIALFREPVSVLSTAFRTSPVYRDIRLRSGFVFPSAPAFPALSRQLFAMFGRREHGTVPAGASVIDLGANCGDYAFFALESGATHVVAVEPLPACCDYIRRTAAVNNVADRLRVMNAACGEGDGVLYADPNGTLPSNTLSATPMPGFVSVPVIGLATIIGTRPAWDVLKIDIEGYEYDLLLATPAHVLARVRVIRLEYHRDPHSREVRIEALTEHLLAAGFRPTRYTPYNADYGLAWFDHATAA